MIPDSTAELIAMPTMPLRMPIAQTSTSNAPRPRPYRIT